MTIGLQAGKGASKFLIEFIVREDTGMPFGNHVDINGRRQTRTVTAKVLPGPPFDTIATNGVADFPAYGYAQARPGRQAGGGNQNQVCRMILAPLLPHC